MIFPKKQKGMTIVEMLVVFAVFAILLSMVFISYKGNQKTIILDSTAYQLASDIRKQQSSAGLDDSTCIKDSYKYSYGIYFDVSYRDRYYLVSDCKGNNINDGSAVDRIKEVLFPSGVELDFSNPSPLFIVFSPPAPSVIINNNPDIIDASISIRSTTDPFVKKTIKINKAGMVDVE